MLDVMKEIEDGKWKCRSQSDGFWEVGIVLKINHL